MIRLFKGTCEAVRAMHSYRPSPRSASLPPNQNGSAATSSSQNGGPSAGQRLSHEDHDDEDERFPQPEGDGDGGYSYDNASTVPLVTKHQVEEEGDVVFDGDEEAAEIAASSTGAGTEVVPYAHRDIKPGRVPQFVFIRT